MSIQPISGSAGQYPMSSVQHKKAVRKTKEEDPYVKLEAAVKAVDRQTEQTQRLGPPVDITNPKEIIARVTGKNTPASLVPPQRAQHKKGPALTADQH